MPTHGVLICSSLFSPIRLAYKGFLLDSKETVGCAGLSAPRVPWGTGPPQVPWASRAWFLSPKVKSQKCPKFQKCQTHVIVFWHFFKLMLKQQIQNVKQKHIILCLVLRTKSTVKHIKCQMSKMSNKCQLSNIKCQKCQMSNVKQCQHVNKHQMSTVKCQKCKMSNAKCQMSNMYNSKCHMSKISKTVNMSNVKCKMSKHAKCHKCQTHVKTVKHVKLPTSSNDKYRKCKM